MLSVFAYRSTNPGTYPAGLILIVKPTGTGDFSGHDNQFAVSNGDATFSFYDPDPQTVALLEDGVSHSLLFWDGSGLWFRYDLVVDPPGPAFFIPPSSLYEIQSTETVTVPARRNFIFSNGLLLDGAIILNGRMVEVNGDPVGIEKWRYREVTDTTTFLPAVDRTINGTSGTFTVYLPAVAKCYSGQAFILKNSGAGTLTLAANGTEKIDGLSTQTVAAGAALYVENTGTGWVIL